MAITHPKDWHMDYENGTSDGGGSSWTALTSGSDGRTYGAGDTLFTSETANFTEAMVGHMIKITSIYREIVGFVSSTAITLDEGYSAGTGRSFKVGGAALKGFNAEWVSLVQPGDTVKLAKSPDPVSIGNATWTSKSKTVTLASARTKTIVTCESAWNAAANVTPNTTTTFFKSGTKMSSFVIASGFTTGQAAWIVTDEADLDLSSYQGISFWASFSASVASGYLVIETYASNDGTGAAIDQFIAPYNFNTYGRPSPFTIMKDGGGNLGSGINSIGITFTVDPGTPTIYIDDILAIKTDDITLTSLISPTASSLDIAGETWYGIQSISGTTVLLDNDPEAKATEGQGYYSNDSPRTVATYIREPIRIGPISTTTGSGLAIGSAYAGTTNSPITISGGWDPSTDLEDGLSLFDIGNGYGYSISLDSACKCLHFKKIGSFRSRYGMQAGYSMIYEDAHSNNHYNRGFYAFRDGVKLIDCYNCNNAGSSPASSYIYLSGFKSNNNETYGANFGAALISTMIRAELNNNAGYAIGPANNLTLALYNVQALDNTGIIDTTGIYSLEVKCFDCDFGLETVSFLSANPNPSRFISINHNKVEDDHRIYYADALVTSETDNRHTEEGIAWKVAVTGANIGVINPVRLKIAEVAVEVPATPTEVTCNLWVYRSGSDITARLYVPDGTLGITNPFYSYATSEEEWEQIFVTFTPLISGVFELYAEVYGGTTQYAIIDDFSVSQG